MNEPINQPTNQSAGLVEAYGVRSVQDLTVLTREELQRVLPGQVEALRAALKRAGVAPIKPEKLKGCWVDVEGRGPGLVVDYKKVANSLLYHSHRKQRDLPTNARQAIGLK